jgi:hypothetical protein
LLRRTLQELPAITKRIAILDSDIAGQKGIDRSRYMQVSGSGKERVKNCREDHSVSVSGGFVPLNMFKRCDAERSGPDARKGAVTCGNVGKVA